MHQQAVVKTVQLAWCYVHLCPILQPGASQDQQQPLWKDPMVGVTLEKMSGMCYLDGNLNSTERPWDRDDTCHNEGDDIPDGCSHCQGGIIQSALI